MLELDNVSVSEEFAVMCMEVQHEDGDKDLVVYGDQGISTEEYDKSTYAKLTKSKVKKKKKKLNGMWLYVQMTACHSRRKGGNLTKELMMKMYTM